jgi:hypothetical protein
MSDDTFPLGALRGHIRAAAKALLSADTAVICHFDGDPPDGPEAGALLDEAAVEIYLARQLLIDHLGSPTQQARARQEER